MKKHCELVEKELKKTVPLYIIGMLFQALTLYVEFLIAQITGNILDFILQGNISKEMIMQEVYKLLLYSFIIFIPNTIKRIFYFRVARKSDTVLRKKVYEKLQYVKEEYYEKTEKGDFLAYLTKEILMIRRFLGNFFQDFGNILFSIVLIVAFSFGKFNIGFIFILVSIICATNIAIYKLYQKKKDLVEEARKEYVKMSNVIEDNTSNFTLIKLYNNQQNQKEIFNEENEEMKQKDYTVGKMDVSINNVINLSEGLTYICILAYGVFLVYKGGITVGDLTVFVTLIARIFSNVKRIKNVTNGIIYFKQAVNRIDNIMLQKNYEKENKISTKEIDKVEVKNLNYKYPANKKYTLKNIHFEIQKNEKIGIIGLFGSGKTTLMNIITGLYDIKENQVFINDMDISKINKYSLFNNISYIMQKDVLLNDTIKNNITLENDYEGKEIINATNNACILEDIFKMEHEFEEMVGEKGVKLSGGQKQRITIARNMIADRDFIILDDVFSALDTKTEKEILTNVIEMKNKTIIIIANKVTDVMHLDKIYLMVNGEFVDQGTHEELINRNPLYKEMYEYEMAGERID